MYVSLSTRWIQNHTFNHRENLGNYRVYPRERWIQNHTFNHRENLGNYRVYPREGFCKFILKSELGF
jgi:hypothetical protein